MKLYSPIDYRYMKLIFRSSERDFESTIRHPNVRRQEESYRDVFGVKREELSINDASFGDEGWGPTKQTKCINNQTGSL